VQTYGIVSLILLVVIALGAFKVWRVLVRLFSKPFRTPNLPKIKKVAFLIVSLTVVSMLTPFLLPFNSGIRLVIYGAYALYAVLGLSQIWDWVNGLLNRGNKTSA
jgi:amino acid transporter